MTLSRDRPEILTPPAHPPACCTQHTITAGPAWPPRPGRNTTTPQQPGGAPTHGAPPPSGSTPPSRTPPPPASPAAGSASWARPRSCCGWPASWPSATSASSPPGTSASKTAPAAPLPACPPDPQAPPPRPARRSARAALTGASPPPSASASSTSPAQPRPPRHPAAPPPRTHTPETVAKARRHARQQTVRPKCDHACWRNVTTSGWGAWGSNPEPTD